MWKNVFFSVLLFFLASAGVVMCVLMKSCAPTWFRPVDVRVLPLLWSENTCTADTVADFGEAERSPGFGLQFHNEYVAEAAMEPGILGITDTLTAFSAFRSNPPGDVENITELFFFGLPGRCDAISGLGNTDFNWVFRLPDGVERAASLSEFVYQFNRINPKRQNNAGFPGTGLAVEHSIFTFWAKSALFATEMASLTLYVRTETASGKKWNKLLRYQNSLN